MGALASDSFEDKASQEKLRKFSPHWLRHLAASHQSKAGITMNIIQENLRHGSSQTTQIYVHSLEDERHASVSQLNFIGIKPLKLEVNHGAVITVVIDKILSLDVANSAQGFLEDVIVCGSKLEMHLDSSKTEIINKCLVSR